MDVMDVRIQTYDTCWYGKIYLYFALSQTNNHTSDSHLDQMSQWKKTYRLSGILWDTTEPAMPIWNPSFQKFWCNVLNCSNYTACENRAQWPIVSPSNQPLFCWTSETMLTQLTFHICSLLFAKLLSQARMVQCFWTLTLSFEPIFEERPLEWKLIFGKAIYLRHG